MQDPGADPLSPTGARTDGWEHRGPRTAATNGTASGGNAKADKEGQLGRMLVRLFFLLLTVAGIVILALASPQFQKATSYDAGADFASVEGGCTVAAVAYSTEQRSDESGF